MPLKCSAAIFLQENRRKMNILWNDTAWVLCRHLAYVKIRHNFGKEVCLEWLVLDLSFQQRLNNSFCIEGFEVGVCLACSDKENWLPSYVGHGNSWSNLKTKCKNKVTSRVVLYDVVTNASWSSFWNEGGGARSIF